MVVRNNLLTRTSERPHSKVFDALALCRGTTSVFDDDDLHTVSVTVLILFRPDRLIHVHSTCSSSSSSSPIWSQHLLHKVKEVGAQSGDMIFRYVSSCVHPLGSFPERISQWCIVSGWFTDALAPVALAKSCLSAQACMESGQGLETTPPHAFPAWIQADRAWS